MRALVLGSLVVMASVACGGGESAVDASLGMDASGRGDAGPRSDAGAVPCESDETCRDLLFCNGSERCMRGAAGADERGCIAGTTPCPGMACDEATDTCGADCAEPDADGDGQDAVTCGGSDCDDADATRFPGATETCDDADEDCDPSTIGSLDADSDGFVSSTCCNTDGSGGANCGSDCDDSVAAVNPGAVEVCNTRDDDCDGLVDEGC